MTIGQLLLADENAISFVVMTNPFGGGGEEESSDDTPASNRGDSTDAEYLANRFDFVSMRHERMSSADLSTQDFIHQNIGKA